MKIEDKQLRSFILDSGLVNATDYDAAEKRAGESKVRQSAGQVLVSEGRLTEDDLRRAQAYVFGIPFIDLKKTRIDDQVLALIPEPIARKNNIIAYQKNQDSVEVAMLDVNDLISIEFIKKKVGLKILPRLTDVDSIKFALLQYQKSLKAEFGDIIQKDAHAIGPIPDFPTGAGETEADLKKMAEDLPVVRIVDTLLKHAILQNASDIHIEALEKEALIRYRIDGILHDALVLPRNAILSITARIKILANLKLDEKRLPQDGRFKIDLNGEKVSFRVSILPTAYGEKTVMRLLRENLHGFTLESVGFHGLALERMHEAIQLSTGLILNTGPTGSGKTTTLYTLLDLLNTPDVNISTIEDPIEYQMARINQTQVKPEIGFTFANGLRSLVRQDPDIIMVGEIRDNETAGLAINAALTGHLVLSTIHTNSAAGAFPRLADMKVEPFLIVSTLKLALGQRLVRKLADNKVKYFLSPAEIASLAKICDLEKVLLALHEEKVIAPNLSWDKIPFYKPKETLDTPDGYVGRVGIYEVLHLSDAIRELVMKGVPDAQIAIQARKEGMMTMLEDGIFKAASGVTTIEEVLRVVNTE